MGAQGRFLTGPTMGHVMRMTATGALGIFFVFLVDLAGLIWISQLGDPTLVAAIGFAFAIQYFSVSFAVGLMIAAIAVISQSIGRGDRGEGRVQAGAALVISVAVLTAVAFFVILERHDLVAFAGATGETARLAARYLAMTMPSVILMAAGLIFSAALRAEGQGAQAMYVTLWAGVLLMVLDPILIVWAELGLDGAAIGLVLFRVCLLILGFHYATRANDLVAWPDFRDVRRIAWPFALIAVPTIGTQMASPAGNYLLTIIMAPFGDDAVAAWAVVGRLTVVAFGGVFALSGAIGGIFGQNLGAGQYGRLREIYRDGLIFCLGYTLAVWVLFLIAQPYIISIFGLEGQGAAVLRAFCTVGLGGFILMGGLFVSNAAFNALGRPGRSTLLNWVKDGVLSWPAALALGTVYGAPGVIYGQTAAGALIGVIAALWGWRYVSGLGPADMNALDPAPPRPYPNPDRYRRR